MFLHHRVTISKSLQKLIPDGKKNQENNEQCPVNQRDKKNESIILIFLNLNFYLPVNMINKNKLWSHIKLHVRLFQMQNTMQ